MASITRHGKGWRAQVQVGGKRRSKVLPSRQAAKDWARSVEQDLAHPARAAASMTVAELLARYAAERTPAKRGARAEAFRLAALGRDPLGAVTLGELGPRHVAAWRDRRLAEVSGSAVNRDMTHLGTVLKVARLEWQLLAHDPMEGVKRPAENPARERLPTARELRRLALLAPPLEQRQGRVWWAFRMSCRTAMRQGELCALRWDQVDRARRVARLPLTKNGKPRAVPLSSRALRLLEELRPVTGGEELVAGLSASVCSTLWRRLCARAGIEDLRFHDARHFATTTLARRLSPLELARVTGHSDLKMLMRYYNETPAQIARRLG